MARHIPTGQLVALKQTNLDECTEEELLQLMVRSVASTFFLFFFSHCPEFFFNVFVCKTLERGSAFPSPPPPEPADLSPGL